MMHICNEKNYEILKVTLNMSDVALFSFWKRVGECETENENMRELVFLPPGYF